MVGVASCAAHRLPAREYADGVGRRALAHQRGFNWNNTIHILDNNTTNSFRYRGLTFLNSRWR